VNYYLLEWTFHLCGEASIGHVGLLHVVLFSEQLEVGGLILDHDHLASVVFVDQALSA
jgi:hypothetical protein